MVERPRAAQPAGTAVGLVSVREGSFPVLAAVEAAAAPQARRIPGQYAGQFKYSDDIFKPLETDEELREYGFDLLIEGKLEKPAA